MGDHGWLLTDSHLVNVAYPERLFPYPAEIRHDLRESCQVYGSEGEERMLAELDFTPTSVQRCVYNLTTGERRCRSVAVGHFGVRLASYTVQSGT